ncbi:MULTISPECIES: OmpA family protein [unclassified Microcoleus]|uniref:OmpA family protein n=1 Tax=unclassified Microcoleus TaxID=2642155 RepID=UPI001DD3CF20|nr:MULTISPECIES: OmpA family protein [unclassified Microcoleus]MCC3600550.1 OmpA family protein [Microcoleus sp. PH2017_26_ELK_O_A]MCC3625615.1 OmpA family protein [Microcoleus sp. PH2017_36_ELK_O_B]
MALPKENPEVENQLEGFVSKPDESAASAATQLDPLLTLLFDLKIIAGSKQQNPESEADSSGKNGQAGALGGSIDLLSISSAQPEEIAAQQNPEPEAASSSGKNSQAGTLGGLMDLLSISSAQPQEIAAQHNSEPEADSSGKNSQAGALGGLMDLLGISSAQPEEIAAVPETGSCQPDSTASPAVADESHNLLFATHKLNTSELERNYSSAKTIDVSADVSDLERESPSLQAFPDLTISDSPQYVQREKSQDSADTAVENSPIPQTLAPPAATDPNSSVSGLSQPSQKIYADASVASIEPNRESQEQPIPLSQRSEIIGDIKQEFNEADSAMGRLQNLIFGSQMSDIEQLKNLLAETDLPGVCNLLASIDSKLEKLEHQIYDPQELIALMLPWIAEILSRKIADSREEVVNAIVPIIDEVIRAKTVENKQAMSSAIGELLPDALAQQIENSPADIARAIAPEMGLAIKEQIRLDQESIAQALAPEMGKAITAQIALERDSMVDALYPVIGSTISKYMAEAIKTINEKVSNSLSMEGVGRKIRSQVQGVSEAELILRESIPFTVQAALLIHKASGLVISEVQHPAGNYQLEAEMVAGMLTAIRSFVNECIVQPGEISELNLIEYGDSKIMLEVAGYCYMAVVIKGEPPQSFINKLRQTLTNLILNYAKLIHEFNGDPGTIPDSVHPFIQSLFDPVEREKSKKPPFVLIGVTIAALTLISTPWVIYQHRRSIDRPLATNAALALASTPELAVYRLNADVEGNTLKLTGNLPNPELREKAAKIAASTAPNLKLDNQIVAVDVPPDPVLTAGEVQRITAVLNRLSGVSISSRYGDRKVTVEGTVMEAVDSQKIAQSLKQIPGVESVVSTVKLDPLKIATRIYFDQGTTTLDSASEEIIASVKSFMDQYPQKQIKIIGHSDRTGELVINQRLSLQRATAVRDALLRQGANPKRLLAVGSQNPPPGVEPNQPLLLSRCVLFEPITKIVNSK